MVARATDRRVIDDGIALTFEHDAELTTEIARLAAAEFDCCSFFRFGLAVDATGVRLEVGAPPHARDIVTAVFGSPA